ncbi:COG4223 family protein [Palleronia abyssalis]|uniref:Mitochondrial inner membrane protein n=1 Tax=Palleronia abyssalis TaxID=1501240 RepID=A0A2R8BSV5_9RHOB|nr:hypothetical protein [Palleronia abyssalis]SPJ23210.1 hypothetical protein PAA8504_01015 [Palleronia abyssalis]
MSDETGSQTDTQSTTAEPRGSGGSAFFVVLLGGFLAGGIGYLAAYYTEFGLFDTGGDDQVAQISEALDAQAVRLQQIEAQADDDTVGAEVGAMGDQLAQLAARLETIESAEPAEMPEATDLTPTNDRISELEDQVAQLQAQTGDQAARIEDNSQAEQLAALTQQIQDLSTQVEEQAATLDSQRQTLESQAVAIEDAGAAATAEANRVSAQAALSGIEAALGAGRPYADEIGALRSTSEVEVPDALVAGADDGVATLGSLQEDFDAFARAALSESVAATAGGGVADRLGAFLRSQTNARSLNERQGGSADAVLSRAEARLNEGNLEAALTEIEALPEEGQDAMSEWLDRANARLDALSGYSDLSSSVNAN